MSARWLAFLLLTVGLQPGCLHSLKSGGAETLKPAVETFHQRIRWKDYRGTTELLVAERREAFWKARRELQDEKDLSITDYQLEEVRLAPDGLRAVVVSHISWVRLPSVTERNDLVASEFVFQNGTWLLATQDAGPFAPELKAPYGD